MIGLRVVIADNEKKAVKDIEDMLRVLGSIVVGKAYEEYSAIKVIRATHPEFVILGGELPFLEVAKTVDENWLAPLILLTERESWNSIESEIDKWEFDYLEKPVKAETLKLKMTVAVERFRRNREFALETERIHSAHTTRNLVDMAKELLVRNLGISEIQAILRIQMLGQEQGISMGDAAKNIAREYSLRNLSA